jgi:hypothetical protein
LLYLLKIHADMDAKIEPPEHWEEPSSDSRPPTVMNLRNPESLRQAHLAQVTHRFLSRPTGIRCVVGSRFWRVAHSRLIETLGRRYEPGRDGSELGRSVKRSRRAGSSSACRPAGLGFRTTCRPAGTSPWRGSKEA